MEFFGVNIEIKADPGRMRKTATAVAAVLASPNGRNQPMLVSSFSAKALGVMRDLAPPVPRGLLLRSVPRRWKAIASRLGCTTIHLNHEALTKAAVEKTDG